MKRIWEKIRAAFNSEFAFAVRGVITFFAIVLGVVGALYLICTPDCFVIGTANAVCVGFGVNHLWTSYIKPYFDGAKSNKENK